MKTILINTFHLFGLLGIIFIPAAFYMLPFQDELTIFVFGDIVNLLIGDHLDFSSDSKGMNMLLLLLFILAAALALFLGRLKFWKDHEAKILVFIQVVVCYYLASRLLVYGFDKIFKTQFYQPEPNTLFTPLGYLSKDILFWSVMGTSKWYCLLSGLAEVIPAVLLLFKRTRVFGLFLIVLVLLHVLTINIGFDISVKLYSLFLLFLAVLLLAPHAQSIITFFFRQQNTQLHQGVGFLHDKRHIKRGLKFFVVSMLFIEALKFPISTGYLHDDDVPRPYLHGAYKVNEMRSGFSDTQIKRFFVHRSNYLIFEYEDGFMEDFKLNIDTMKHNFIIEDENNQTSALPYRVYCKGDCLDLGIIDAVRDTVWYKSDRLNIFGLPALQDEFHWTIDAFKNAE